VLNELKFDPELFVRKSVANHLNDISKDHPRLVVKVLKSWKREARGPEDLKRLEWIVRHSLRTLIKRGDPGALGLLGVELNASVELRSFRLERTNLKLNERLEFEFKLKSTGPKPQKFVVDYKLHFVTASGALSAKVFKLKVVQLSPGEEVRIQKQHHLKPITTRRYYPGTHAVEVMVNGVSLKKAPWELRV
jgi:hypothetical protein